MATMLADSAQVSPTSAHARVALGARRILRLRAALATCVALVTLAVACEPAFANHEGTPSSVSLVAEKASVTIPESIKLTANASPHLYATGYSVVVVDDDSGTTLGNSCSQTPCDKYGSTSWSGNADPQPRHFHAELHGPGGGVVAMSGQVTVAVRKHVWDIVSVVPSPTSQVVPGSVQFVATLDHTTYGTPYSIHIYDVVNPGPPTTCNQYQCARYVARQWSDNVSPKPGRVRVEVRDASGDIASNRVYGEAPFWRFIFTPTLSFWTQSTSGTVVHKASARLATGDPSLYGTPYRIKIRKADGTEVCSAPQVGCDATVSVGETYRAVVEDSQGRNFGDSGAWTLTADGPRSEVHQRRRHRTSRRDVPDRHGRMQRARRISRLTCDAASVNALGPAPDVRYGSQRGDDYHSSTPPYRDRTQRSGGPRRPLVPAQPSRAPTASTRHPPHRAGRRGPAARPTAVAAGGA
jgi:hypothetical protein